MPDPILLDTNILPDIARGNTAAAQALRRLIDQGTTVYISNAAYEELVTRAPNPQLQAHYREMLADLGIRRAPPGPMAERVEVYAQNIQRPPAPNQPALRDYDRRGDPSRPGDVFVAAQARAAGARLWTLDQKIIRGAPRLGVKLAAECRIIGVTGTEDPVRGRQLLGLAPILVTASGTVIRQPPGGGGGGGGTAAIVGMPDMEVSMVGGPSPRGVAIIGGIELLFRGLNAAFGWLNDRRNQEMLQRDLNAQRATITQRAPTKGVLVVVYQIVHEPRGPQADSLIQPGPVYSHLELYLGQTEDEARRAWAGQAAVRAGGSHGFARWFPPAVAPEAATLRSPFPRRQLATFVQGRERLQDVEWAGVSGFDDMGETPLATAGNQVLFHVLEPPQQIFFFNGPQRFEVSIPLVTRASGGGGALIAVDLDPLLGVFVSRVTAVPVFAANDLATRLFDAAHPTRDNLDQLRGYMHVRRMRWVRPENVEVIP